MHDGARVLVHLFVNVVGHHQIGGVIAPCLRAHVGHNVLHGAAIEPIVGVDHLEVQAGRVGKPGVHRLSMPAVFLMDGLDDAGVALLPCVGFLSRAVLGRAVVDDDDLDVVKTGLPTASQQRFNAFVHVFRGVVARNGERDGFHACPSRRWRTVRRIYAASAARDAAYARCLPFYRQVRAQAALSSDTADKIQAEPSSRPAPSPGAAPPQAKRHASPKHGRKRT